MDEQQSPNELAREMRRALRERGLSVNAAAQRFEISREALTKMWNGRPTTVEIAEKFAARLGEDPNRWRVLNGFTPIEDAYAQALKRELTAMRDRLAADGLAELAPERGAAQGGSAGLTPEDARAEIAELERVLRKLASRG
jgi:plasmid maintenance system antidote protein VapI